MNRYLDAVHAMQSGVAMKMNYDGSETSPKSLRVGVNSALCDHAALALILMRKGIITEEEYKESVTVVMEEEVKRYEEWLEQHLGERIHLA